MSGLVLDPPWVHLDMEAVEVVFFWGQRNECQKIFKHAGATLRTSVCFECGFGLSLWQRAWDVELPIKSQECMHFFYCRGKMRIVVCKQQTTMGYEMLVGK